MKDPQTLYRAVLNNVNCSVWAVDLDGTIILSEGETLKVFGLQAGQLVGQNVYVAFGDELPRRALRGETFTHKVEVGANVFETRYTPLRDERGEIVGAVGVTFNVTERIRFEHDLEVKVALIEKQQQAMRSMSMPIIEVWNDVLALPIIGMIDSERAAQLMQTLLQEVAQRRARFAILDLTGVDTVDTGTADHLIKVVKAVQLLGARAIITGIQPAIANVIASLGTELAHVTTLLSLREAIKLSMRETSAEPTKRL